MKMHDEHPTSTADDRHSAALAWRIAALTGLLFVGCVVVDLAASNQRRPFGYQASDAYYYLTVARHAVEDGKLAFDGEHSTNGFHPLWQWTLVPLTLGARMLHAPPHRLLLAIVIVQALLVAAALVLLVLALARDRVALPLAPLLPLGAYGALAIPVWWHAFGTIAHGPRSPVEPLSGTLWSYVNGMESPLVLLTFAWAVWLWLARDPVKRPRDAALLGGALSLLTLARLDHVLFALPILARLWLDRRAATQAGDARSRNAWWFAAVIFGVPVATYAVYNWIAFGSPMPVSGGLKSSFPHVNHANLDRLWASVAHLPKQNYWRLLRIEQLVIPMLFAIVFLVTTQLRRRATRLDHLLAAVALGVLLLGAYDLLFVDLTLHGSWYLPISTLFPSLLLLRALGSWRPGLRVTVAIVVGGALVVVAGFVKLHRYVRAGENYAHFYFDVAPRVRAHYGDTPPRILENDDGIVSFATGFRAMAGMGLTLDPEGARAWSSGQIVPLAVARDYHYITSTAYWPIVPSISASDAQVRAFLLNHLFVPNAERFSYAVDYSNQNFAIIRVEPRK
ncbi:MAG TPA: hypothetical protein VIA18_32500 [Polyangia bacterium]|nr:hypothetical protein [Polyangia bacterium]